MARLFTNFASPDRDYNEHIHAEWKYFDTDSPIANLLNLVPKVILILNQNRQVMFANRAALEFAGAADIEQVLDVRPGEIVRCTCFSDGGDVVFWVHNPAVMTESVRLQIFNRSFSTKAPVADSAPTASST